MHCDQSSASLVTMTFANVDFRMSLLSASMACVSSSLLVRSVLRGVDIRRRTQEIAARAYEIYEDGLHGESLQDQNWLEAERETRSSPAEHPKVA